MTIWTSTQVPFAARSGVAHVLQIPESHVRIVVPLLGGGFGSKCDFHFEGHVAALARAAGRPVKLVFSRQEEFIAPDHRREGMVIELETGARRDGTLVARRGRLVLDGGAYCGEGGFFAQLAAMHACGPYVVEHVNIESTLVYTNNQPSGSIRAPTAPQVCWALEQHTDELAAALGFAPVELRRRTLIDEGAEGPTRQVFGPIGMKQTLERALELIGSDGDLPEDEGIGVACGWWPSFGMNSGAYVKLNADGSGTIVTGAQENGSGAVMALPLLAAEVLGLQPDGLLDPLPGHGRGPRGTPARPARRRRSTTAAQSSQAPGEVRERLLDLAGEKLEADREDLELADGTVRVQGAPAKAVTIAELAGSGVAILGKGSGESPKTRPATPRAASGGSGSSRSSSRRCSPTPPASRSTARRASSASCTWQPCTTPASIINPIGANGQVYGGVVMGIGQAL